MPGRSSDWHITGWKAFVLLPIAVPVILFLRLFGIGQYKKRSAEEVAGYIRDFTRDSGGEWDWDDFISVRIEDPELEALRDELEALRDEASMVKLPVTESGIEELKRLMRKAEALAGTPQD